MALAVAVGFTSMTSFARRHARIATRDDLERYKAMASTQMFVVLVLMSIALVVPIAIALPLVTEGEIEPNWWPIGVMVLVAMGSKPIRELEARVRNTPVTPELAREYAAINKVWVGKALPRFPTAVEPQQLRSGFACPLHGTTDAIACPRCGAQRCASCDAAKQNAAALCADCAAHYLRARNDGVDAELSLRSACYVLTALGLADGAFGLFSLLDQRPFVSLPIAIALMVVGASTFVASTLASWRLRLGYRLSFMCAALHLPIVPVGTLASIWSIIKLREAASVITSEYQAVVAETQNQLELPHFRYMLLSLVLLHIHGAGLAVLAVIGSIVFHG